MSILLFKSERPKTSSISVYELDEASSDISRIDLAPRSNGGSLNVTALGLGAVGT